MTENEFDEWHNHYVERFPRESDKIGKPTVRTWFSVFGHVELDAAKQVVNDLQSGALERPKYSTVDHLPAFIRNEAERIGARKYVNRTIPEDLGGECRCYGSGIVDCYHPEMVKDVLEGKDGIKFRTHGIPCSCPKGRRYATTEVRVRGERKVLERERYQKTIHCFSGVTIIVNEAINSIEEWDREERTGVPAGHRETAFDDF